ncbi:hypothetical protein EEB13_30235 [Rhodococcus sp. WS3]|nr:hypothetical protein EEB13_30235 [Rhodococcus sp. WS3]
MFGARASIDETTSDVTVSVGTLAAAVGMACTMEVVEATLDLARRSARRRDCPQGVIENG